MQELKENSRGAILSIEGLITFIFLMIYHKLLGFTYDSVSKKFTFIIGFLFLGVYTALQVYFYLRKRIKQIDKLMEEVDSKDDVS